MGPATEKRVTCGPVVKEMKEKKVRLEAKLAARPAISFFFLSFVLFLILRIYKYI
jgi:hypothetical protein